MDSIETDTHVFVIRLWRDDDTDAADESAWRGHITHALSGERQPLTNLSYILTFVRHHLHSQDTT